MHNENAPDWGRMEELSAEREHAASDIIDAINKHTRGLKSLADTGSSLTEIRAQAQRMEDEVKALKARYDEAPGARWVPTGDADTAIRNYATEDTLHLGRHKRTFSHPSLGSETIERWGYLDDPHPVTAEQQRAQGAYHRYALALALAKRYPGQKTRQAAIWAYSEMVREIRSAGGMVAKLAERAITGGSGSGGELIQLPRISDVVRDTDLSRPALALFAMQDAPAPTFKPPQLTGRALAKRRGATTDSPANYQISNFTTSDSSISVVDMSIMALIDPLWINDSATLIGDGLALILDWLRNGLADSLELARIHGDTAGTHQDDLTTTLGGRYTSGDLDGADSPMKFWLGLRARAHDNSKTSDAGGSFTSADHAAAMALLDVHAPDAVILTGINCLYSQILFSSEFTTVEKVGAAASLLTGRLPGGDAMSVGAIGGRPVYLSNALPKVFDTSSGLISGSNNGNVMVYANPNAYVHYMYDGGPGTGEFDESVARQGARYVGSVVRRIDYRRIPSGEFAEAVLYNL
jgi:hypothetical protein